MTGFSSERLSGRLLGAVFYLPVSRFQLDRRLFIIFGVYNLFVPGRKLNVFHLLLAGFIIQLVTALFGLPDHFSKPVL
jgi:hypothetical protein